MLSCHPARCVSQFIRDFLVDCLCGLKTPTADTRPLSSPRSALLVPSEIVIVDEHKQSDWVPHTNLIGLKHMDCYVVLLTTVMNGSTECATLIKWIQVHQAFDGDQPMDSNAVTHLMRFVRKVKQPNRSRLSYHVRILVALFDNHCQRRWTIQSRDYQLLAFRRVAESVSGHYDSLLSVLQSMSEDGFHKRTHDALKILFAVQTDITLWNMKLDDDDKASYLQYRFVDDDGFVRDGLLDIATASLLRWNQLYNEVVNQADDAISIVSEVTRVLDTTALADKVRSFLIGIRPSLCPETHGSVYDKSTGGTADMASNSDSEGSAFDGIVEQAEGSASEREE